jgi:hypothetical protein
MGLTPELTGAGARSAEGTNTGHKNGEAMASIGVRVERPVRQRRAVEGVENTTTFHVFAFGINLCSVVILNRQRSEMRRPLASNGRRYQGLK